MPRKRTCWFESNGDGTVHIHMKHGYVAVIDEEDLPLVEGYAWHAHPINQNGYARPPYPRAPIPGTRGWGKISLHHLLLNPEPGYLGDHIDGDPWNNRRSNLRICTTSQNQQNRIHLTTNTSGYRGVSWSSQKRRWRARVAQRSIGYFKTKEEAARAYDDAAREEFGEFARLNFPKEGERQA